MTPKIAPPARSITARSITARSITARSIDQAIRKNLARLRKPGVLTVRPGFEIAGHQLTGKAAIVATVHTKTSALPKADLLPTSIDRIPVDVREATPNQRLRAHDPAAAALTQAYGRPENKEPTWPYERSMPGGKLLSDPPSMTHAQLAALTAQQPAAQRALVAQQTKQKINYVPANVPLTPVTTTTTLTAHVSPDAGLVTLKKFLAATNDSLVIGMYDFTSGEILQQFEDVLNGAKTLQMVLDNPPPNATRDQTDTQTVQQLNQSLGRRSKITRALERADVFASAWMFPAAYHIKVIVQDDSVLWLSSGNLNKSNQPDLATPPQTEDRDWHVIIEDAGLAQTFAAYLNQDFASALKHQAAQPAEVMTAVQDAHAKLAADTNPPPPPPLARVTATPVPAKVFNNVAVTITPLLTPDTVPGDPTQGQYLSNMLKLIASATSRLFIQLQYIEASSGTAGYNALLSAIADRVNAGVDVRLIESLEFGEKWAEKMKSEGIDLTANISLQSNVHNKGFVVDSRVAVVSSQNFSPEGVLENRDAGVIIENAAVAGYFEQIFLSDWSQKAKPFAPKSAATAAKRNSGAQKKKRPAKAAAKTTKLSG